MAPCQRGAQQALLGHAGTASEFREGGRADAQLSPSGQVLFEGEPEAAIALAVGELQGAAGGVCGQGGQPGGGHPVGGGWVREERGGWPGMSRGQRRSRQRSGTATDQRTGRDGRRGQVARRGSLPAGHPLGPERGQDLVAGPASQLEHRERIPVEQLGDQITHGRRVLARVRPIRTGAAWSRSPLAPAAGPARRRRGPRRSPGPARRPAGRRRDRLWRRWLPWRPTTRPP